MQIWNSKVIVRHSEKYAYSFSAPYHPNKLYPELEIFGHDIDGSNFAYEGVRQLFIDAGFDAENLGRTNWNPLNWIIKPGMTVLLKPNFVRHYNDTGEDITGLITQGSIIRAVSDYAYLALKGSGRILIADSPHDDADFSEIKSYIGLESLQKLYMNKLGFNLECLDLRQYQTRKINGVVVQKDKLFGDPLGYKIVDLGNESAFSEVDFKSQNFYGADYDVNELHSHHQPGIHRYCIAQSILDSDAVLNLPKLKTHKKCGITLSMKNLVGINGNKNFLPHFTLGMPKQGGDQFCENRFKNYLEHYILKHFKKFFKFKYRTSHVLGVPLKNAGKKVFGDTNISRVRSGNWYGNDTAWRMVFDLNRILLFCDRQGLINKTQQRHYLSIIDGIVGGEGNGPLACNNKNAGFLIMGQNPLYTDVVAASCMGFSPSRILKLQQSINRNLLKLTKPFNSKIECIFNGQSVSLRELSSRYSIPFKPHFGWHNIILEKTEE